MAFVKLIELSRCRLDEGTFVSIDGRELAVFRLGHDVIAIDNACPHANGNLSAGEVVDRVVTCPWHEWRFDLSTGRCVDSDKAQVVRYPVEIRDDVVYVDFETEARHNSGELR